MSSDPWSGRRGHPAVPLSGEELDRAEFYRSIARAESLGDLMQQLARALASFELHDFDVFLVGEGEAVLTFSRGRTSQSDGKIALRDHPWLMPLLDGRSPVLADATSAQDRVFHPASIAFSLPAPSGVQGVLVVYGLIEASLLDPPAAQELDAIVELFSIALHQIRRHETLQRSYQRATAKLDEFQDAQSILFLRDKREILEAVLSRALRNLGAMTGIIVLDDTGDWGAGHRRGDFTGEQSKSLAHMVDSCFAQRRPGLINSLSGEQSWSFDIDTIHMASVVVFPLMDRGRCIGVLGAFDATVSLDNIETVQATTRAGATAIENWEAQQTIRHQERLQEQMDLAAKAQQRLLPARDPSFRGLRLAHFSLYCDETGGDYVDAFTYGDGGSVGSLVVGDVAGHGLSAAMLMVDLRARLRTMMRLQNPWSPHRVLDSASEVLTQDSAPDEFVTLFLATVDSRTGVMRYANAGHEHPLIYKPKQERWIELASTGIPLGLVSGSRYEVGSLALEPGDILVAMTDGVTEAQASSGAVFGTHAIKHVVETLAGVSAEQLVEAVVAETVAHRDRRAFNDDLTFLVAVVDDVTLRFSAEPPLLSGAMLAEFKFASASRDKDEGLRRIDSLLRETLPGRDSAPLMVSCEEAMSNALVHGNRGDVRKPIAVRIVLSRETDELTVIVSDQGDGFDPRQRVLDHFDESSLHRVSGRGLVIMANLVDRVWYWNGGRSVALTKKIEPSRPSP